MRLLTRTSIFYFFASLIVFIVAGFVTYYLVKGIFYKQLDDTLLTEKTLIEEQINYSDSLPDFGTVFGHMIQVTVFKSTLPFEQYMGDTLIKTEPEFNEVPCRYLYTSNTSLKNRGYTIIIFKPTIETTTLIKGIWMAMAILFLTLIGLLLLVNYFISRTVWTPFHRTLRKLSHYHINQEDNLQLPHTSITEFKLLHQVLEEMSLKIRRDFQNLKEFNENASHELQTPLAIIKTKLDLLIQNEQLNQDQMQLIESVYDAVSRISKLNHGLLLISKIENDQFSQTERVDLGLIVQKQVDYFEEMISMKGITLSIEREDSMWIRMNPALADTLVSNLLSNAIKHNYPSGKIIIQQTKEYLSIMNSGTPLTITKEQLFERFKKSDRSSDSIGLGLAIVKEITTLYGLKIEYHYHAELHRFKLFV